MAVLVNLLTLEPEFPFFFICPGALTRLSVPHVENVDSGEFSLSGFHSILLITGTL